MINFISEYEQIYYDADPEEFDILLYLSGVLKDEKSMQNFIKGMNSLQQKS